jgi:polyisoprenoid-binding protein YceI
LASGAELKISGTSSLHDWDMVSSTATGKGEFVLENGKIKEVKTTTLEMPAESIKSGKSAMDKNAYAALKTKEHKQVKFSLKEFVQKGDAFEASGNFTIAGVTKTVSFPVSFSKTGDKINFKGSYPFKLTDFNIDPPTALFGTVKTGNEVRIHFNVTFQPNK